MTPLEGERISHRVEISAIAVGAGDVSYPADRIRSVSVHRPRVAALYAVAGCLVLVALAGLGTADAAGLFSGYMAGAAIVALTAWFKPGRLVLNTTDGSQDIALSRDMDHLAEIKASIERSMAHQSPLQS
jgi:hypothetical protein